MPKWSAFWDVINVVFIKTKIEKIVDEINKFLLTRSADIECYTE